MSQADIHEQLQERRFDPTFASTLEAYVEEQVKNGTTDLEANLALLRFYQYSPSTAKTDVTRKILIKALMALPATDFMLCMYIVPPSLQSDTGIAALKSLADKLESCFFAQFWKELSGSAVTEVPKFEETIRAFIVGVISSTYQLISTEELSSYVNLSGRDLDALVVKQGWEKEGDSVKIPRNEQNQAKIQIKQEGVSFEHVAPIVVASYR
mmetsp:Transcript_39090/g.96213  ORF Transcript_39090/g.96213 Transcript_39090/m.96213 type:complete len:211 (-) Transcript_39090:146-778(-)|eukprot:CAMPEP_0206261908 /NCGR_PEP_ID=MMETSP0047_2-20121206/27928_1 /ASSEMBLY_ACC=CAM_ASM_000192 /TAXON_ID=195065 /ORGANISM="Chroomonas mesostigmatica_cf, Strain CCMP1168" /LENGTH=210 /DNA_ID=CAMNT_0053689199 /DNA_START=18 /DNA_END=650 /DNA_ORIENTATION=+